MHIISKNKMEHLEKLSTKQKIINALAIDQRESLKEMMNKDNAQPLQNQQIVDYKKLVSKELTKYASSILLDSQYGIEAANARNKDAGLIISYEVSGYDKNKEGRLPNLLSDLSVYRMKELGANGIKILLYYDVDEIDCINSQKQAFVERVGSECLGEEVPFFLEIITYDSKIEDKKSLEYAKVKPNKVISSMKEFSRKRYNVDVLKMEVPVNMEFVEGYGTSKNILHTQKEALKYFEEQSKVTHLPFIFLSAGVSTQLFIKTIKFAKKGNSEFNGILCGRATWKDSVSIFVDEGIPATEKWLETIGKQNINEINSVVEECATPFSKRVTVAKK